MSKTDLTRVHWSFWLAGIFALLWNIGGCVNFLMQTNVDFVATLPETHRAIINDRPGWATAGFALGVFGGAIGAILLLLKKNFAQSMFIASLIGILVTMVHTAQVASNVTFSAGEIFVMILLPIIVAIGLIAYSRRCRAKNWLR